MDHVHQQASGDYKLDQEDGFWLLRQRERDVVGHHKVELNKAVMEETWYTMFRFDEQQRQLEDFQERCDEYQTNGGLLATLPTVLMKDEEGKRLNTLIGARFTSIQFKVGIFILNILNFCNHTFNAFLKQAQFCLQSPVE